jgi:hypothetical protein
LFLCVKSGIIFLILDMKKNVVFLLLSVIFMGNSANAELLDLNTALQNTYKSCVGIDEILTDMKKLAGINTAVTAVGSGLGIGATVTGFVKASKDKKIEQLLRRLKEIEETKQNTDVPDKREVLSAADDYFSENKDENRANEYQSEIDKLTKQSKSLGNWRTGLLAGNTVTNIAGAIIAGKNNGDEVQILIDECRNSVSELNNSILQAKMNGEDISEAQNIKTACSAYDMVDVSKINIRAKGAKVSSIIGAGMGAAGTITSGIANSDKIRDDDTNTGKQKEKNLNTAANVLSVGATAATISATVFNATQISAIKKAASAAQECEKALRQ